MVDDPQNDPALYRRRLRAELRKAREALGLSAKDVTVEMEWSAAKLSRIEAGTVNIQRNDLRALLNLYEVTDVDKVEELTDWARRARERSPWWQQYRDVASPELISLCGFEASSKVLRNFEPLLVPGLLQTEDYAKELLKFLRGAKDPRRINQLVALRLRRQDILAEEQRSQNFLIDEAAIRRLVGGTSVMRRQLQAIRDAIGKPKVQIGIVPFSAGMYRALRVPYVVYEFEDPQDETILYLENPQGESVIYEESAPPDEDEGVPTPGVYLEVYFELEQAITAEITAGCLDDALAALNVVARNSKVIDLPPTRSPVDLTRFDDRQDVGAAGDATASDAPSRDDTNGDAYGDGAPPEAV